MYRLFALLCSLLFGVSFSQLPEFGQQYRQRMGGAIDELSDIVGRFDKDARKEKLSREEALTRYRAAADDFLAKRGRDMANSIERLDRLLVQQKEIAEANGFARLVPLVRQIDTDIARRTLSDFEPAVPITTEGLGLAALGLLIGRLVAPLLGLFAGRRPWRRRAAPAAVAAAPGSSGERSFGRGERDG